MIEVRNLTILNKDWFTCCTLDQQTTAERLGISDRYLRELNLRELEEHCPPRTVRGSGQESEYEWPAVMLCFFEFQIARSRNDDWTLQQWSDGCWFKRRLEKVESRVVSLVKEMKKAKIAPAIIKSARHFFRD
jgi:hypothetical protein